MLLDSHAVLHLPQRSHDIDRIGLPRCLLNGGVLHEWIRFYFSLRGTITITYV